jgi:hypothetical protein
MKKNIVKKVKVPKRLIDSIDDKIQQEDIENASIISDFSGTLIPQSAAVILGKEMLKHYLEEKDYSNFFKKSFSLSGNFLNYLFRETFNLKSQKLRTIYSNFNGLEEKVFNESISKINLNPKFVKIISEIRKENNLNDNDYISLSILTRDLNKIVKSFVVNKKDILDKAKIHIPKQQIYGNKVLNGEPSIYVKTSNKQRYLDKLQKNNLKTNIVYITDGEKLREFNHVKYLIRI